MNQIARTRRLGVLSTEEIYEACTRRKVEGRQGGEHPASDWPGEAAEGEGAKVAITGRGSRRR